MAYLVINDEHLTAIAEAIREKGGADTYKPREMAEAILNLPTLPKENFILTNGSETFKNGCWDWFVEMYKDNIQTKDIKYPFYMFSRSKLSNIPFSINLVNYSDGGPGSCEHMFLGCINLTDLPPINGPFSVNSLKGFCSQCEMLRGPIDFSWLTTYHNEHSIDMSSMFYYCTSLRSIPETSLSKLHTLPDSNYGYSDMHTYNMFEGCYSLDEVKGIYPFDDNGYTFSNNAFYDAFSKCYRIKDVVFATDENNSPYIRNWSNQTIYLTQIGYVDANYITVSDYIKLNNGIAADKEIKDLNSYDLLKDDIDSFTYKKEYSRYNRRSAYETIISLPDVSSGANNTIVFTGDAGSLTNEGAINTLTEEEIAVATAKGWTVSLV